MEYRFDVKLTESDYLEYNTFTFLKSPYGKKQILGLRIREAAIICLFIIIALIRYGADSNPVAIVLPFVILWTIIMLLTPFLLKLSLKSGIKNLKKNGKMGYTPDSTLEFFEDVFVETTAENKTEQLYASIERISVIKEKVIYIHVNNVMAFILPMSCFDSAEQYESFLEFIKTKNNSIQFY